MLAAGGTKGVNIASAAASAVGGAVKYFFREDVGDKPREVRTHSDADWEIIMADAVGYYTVVEASETTFN